MSWSSNKDFMLKQEKAGKATSTQKAWLAKWRAAGSPSTQAGMSNPKPSKPVFGSSKPSASQANAAAEAKRKADAAAKAAAAKAAADRRKAAEAAAKKKQQEKIKAQEAAKAAAAKKAAKAAADKKAAQVAAAKKAAAEKQAAEIKRQQEQAQRLAAKAAADAKAAAASLTGKNSLVGGDGLTNEERYAKRRAEEQAKAAAAAYRLETDERGNANAFGTEWDVNSNRDNPYGVTSIKDSSGLGFSGNPEHFITTGNPADMKGIEVGYNTDKKAKPPMPPAETTKGQPSGGGIGAFFNGIRNGSATNIKGNAPAGGTDAAVTVDQTGGNPSGMFNNLMGVVNNVRDPNTTEPIKFTQAEIDKELEDRAAAQAAADAAAAAAAQEAAGQAQAELFNPTQEAGPVRNRNFQTVNYGTQGGPTAGVNTGIGVAGQSQATPWADAYMRAQQSSAKQGPISGLFSKEMENS